MKQNTMCPLSHSSYKKKQGKTKPYMVKEDKESDQEQMCTATQELIMMMVALFE